MLKETKLALRISTSAYDAEIASLIKAGAKDLQVTAGVNVSGISLAVTADGVVDTSTIADELVKRAIITYVRQHFGSPADYDRLKVSYDEQKAQLITASGYGQEGDE